ncbi:MAG: hypothetical protein D6719_13205 [Candidatus Dadabacteria bacterium]|nr:MAG: hypothetical protein D6719_13205 [Candidatus Dadabacteria bacterium]
MSTLSSQWAYNNITTLLSLVAGPGFLFNPRGRKLLAQRFGDWQIALENVIWAHAASLGETNGLMPLIEKIEKEKPARNVFFTATTTTGLDKAKEKVATVRLLPFDSPIWIKRALKNLSIKSFICAEKEVWPALLSELKQRNVPCYMVNAMLSERSFRRYRRWQVFAEAICSFDLILAANKSSAERFRLLGVADDRITVTGSSKYDIKPSINSSSEALQLKKRFFANDAPVLVLGSFRPGEEKVWFPAIKQAYSKNFKFNLVVAPRHPEKFGYFKDKLKDYGINFSCWSNLSKAGSAPQKSHTVLLDTLGMLEKVYSFASVAFIGGTLVDFGGHNPLEAAAYGACVALGPYTGNIDELVESFKAQEGYLPVKSIQDSYSVIERMLQEPEALRKIGMNGQSVWQQNCGAVERIFNIIGPLI